MDRILRPNLKPVSTAGATWIVGNHLPVPILVSKSTHGQEFCFYVYVVLLEPEHC